VANRQCINIERQILDGEGVFLPRFSLSIASEY